MQHEQTIVRGQYYFNYGIKANCMSKTAQQKVIKSKPRSLCQINEVSISPPLITTRHFCRRMAKLFLDVAFVHISARSQASTQTMAGEQRETFFFRQVAADTCIQHSLLDQAPTYYRVWCAGRGVQSRSWRSAAIVPARKRGKFGPRIPDLSQPRAILFCNARTGQCRRLQSGSSHHYHLCHRGHGRG